MCIRDRTNTLMTEELALSELFNPDVFLNALRQKTSRKLKVPIDGMKIAVGFESGKLQSPFVVKVRGLLLQGCGFESGRLVDPPQDLQEFIQLPICYMAWISSSDPDPYPATSLCLTPIYYDSMREKLLIKVQMPNSGSVSDRVISGVAVLLAESE
eukprot:TRINITY_DN8621_c0_g1_i9.p1 TRINITY_DN8621_c0_g1~~TRINITY_DN8621_c0_g1_i9.p1  ORF type:complete len:156 (-),score=41.51 TRINITY_DN8621_c0_g1_i9:163-630(-)